MDERRARRRLSGKGILPLKNWLWSSFILFRDLPLPNQMVENNGIFPREAISTLCRLAGWSEKGGTWALYIKEVMERHLDSSAYIYRLKHAYGVYLNRLYVPILYGEGQMHVLLKWLGLARWLVKVVVHFFPFLPCLGESETPIAGGKSLNVKGLRKKCSGHLSSGTSSNI